MPSWRRSPPLRRRDDVATMASAHLSLPPGRPLYRRHPRRPDSMSDMRLTVAGAGGRMGRTLVRAIAETPGLVLAGATEGEGSPFLGQDSGVLAGLPPNRINVVSEVRPGSLAADGIIDFTVPAATVKLAALAAETKLVHIIGTTGTSAE